MFKCKLQIEGLYKKLSLEDGINLKDLVQLLGSLSKALGKKSKKFTLTTIENTSYSPIIETEDIEVVDEFNNIHRAIGSLELERLPEEYQDYAETLNKILFENNLYITAQDQRNETGIKITHISKLSSNQYYYSITTISGVINALYGRDENRLSVAVKPSVGKNITVRISQEQERNLSPYYKVLNISLRLRNKIDVSNGNIIESKLLNYTIPSDKGFLVAIKNVQDTYGDIFSHVDDSARVLNDIRNSYE